MLAPPHYFINILKATCQMQVYGFLEQNEKKKVPLHKKKIGKQGGAHLQQQISITIISKTH